jgi:hypothetical protein
MISVKSSDGKWVAFPEPIVNASPFFRTAISIEKCCSGGKCGRISRVDSPIPFTEKTCFDLMRMCATNAAEEFMDLRSVPNHAEGRRKRKRKEDEEMDEMEMEEMEEMEETMEETIKVRDIKAISLARRLFKYLQIPAPTYTLKILDIATREAVRRSGRVNMLSDQARLHQILELVAEEFPDWFEFDQFDDHFYLSYFGQDHVYQKIVDSLDKNSNEAMDKAAKWLKEKFPIAF